MRALLRRSAPSRPCGAGTRPCRRASSSRGGRNVPVPSATSHPAEMPYTASQHIVRACGVPSPTSRNAPRALPRARRRARPPGGRSTLPCRSGRHRYRDGRSRCRRRCPAFRHAARHEPGDVLGVGRFAGDHVAEGELLGLRGPPRHVHEYHLSSRFARMVESSRFSPRSQTFANSIRMTTRPRSLERRSAPSHRWCN